MAMEYNVPSAAVWLTLIVSGQQWNMAKYEVKREYKCGRTAQKGKMYNIVLYILQIASFHSFR